MATTGSGSPKPSSPNAGNKNTGGGGKKAGSNKNQKMILSADIYDYGTVYVGPREVEGESQYTFSFGEDDYCISFKVTFNDSKAQDYDGAMGRSALLDKPGSSVQNSAGNTEGGKPTSQTEASAIANTMTEFVFGINPDDGKGSSTPPVKPNK